jgi:hypothetical protein
MPLHPLARFSIKIAEEELERCGVYLLETFPDGMTRWGNDSTLGPFTGSSTIADTYADGTICMTDIRAILNKVDRAGHFELCEDRIAARVHNEGHSST